jgi:hypothetical protein
MAEGAADEVSEVFLVRVTVSGPRSVATKNLKYAKQNVRRIADTIPGDVSVAVYNKEGDLEASTVIGKAEQPPDRVKWREG